MIQPADMHAINLRFLQLIQKAAHTDVGLASTMFGVPERVASEIATYPLDELERLATTNSMMFRARFDESTFNAIRVTESPALRGAFIESNH